MRLFTLGLFAVCHSCYAAQERAETDISTAALASRGETTAQDHWTQLLPLIEVASHTGYMVSPFYEQADNDDEQLYDPGNEPTNWITMYIQPLIQKWIPLKDGSGFDGSGFDGSELDANDPDQFDRADVISINAAMNQIVATIMNGLNIWEWVDLTWEFLTCPQPDIALLVDDASCYISVVFNSSLFGDFNEWDFTPTITVENQTLLVHLGNPQNLRGEYVQSESIDPECNDQIFDVKRISENNFLVVLPRKNVNEQTQLYDPETDHVSRDPEIDASSSPQEEAKTLKKASDAEAPSLAIPTLRDSLTESQSEEF